MTHRFACFRRIFLTALAVIGLSLPVYATDWPTYMHDNSHSGVTTDALTLGTLDEQWVYTPPAAPVPAWPEIQLGMAELPTKIKFDDAFYTVGVGDLVYFGSSVDDKIYALDADDGSVVWSYFTGGSVRTAPTVSGGYLYASSDDGYIYCLNATTGAFVWKYSTMTTRKYVLGNGRIVSKCPSRSGVVVDSGTVYFGIGNFRENGISMVALDADDGSEIWRNNDASQYRDFTPQGYPVLTSTRIIAPSGRMRPASFSRSTGAYDYTAEKPSTFKGSGAGVYLTVVGDKFFAGTQNVLHSYDESDGMLDGLDWMSSKRLVATATRYYILQGQDAPGTGTVKVYAYDRDTIDTAGNHSTATLNAARLWTFTQDGLDSMILTANHLIVGGDEMVYALDVSDGSNDWEHAVDGRAAGLTVADSQLYVSTDTGKIHCFGNGTPVSPTTPTFVEPFNDGNKSKYEDAAAAILAETGITKGYVLVTGKGDAAARLGYELAEDQPNLKVHCIVTGDADALSARQALQSALVYGTRVWVDQYQSGSNLLCADYFANLVVRVQEPGESAPSAAELLRVTKPAHGWLLVGEVLGDNNLDPSAGDQSTWDAAGDFYSDSSFLQGAGTWYILDRDVLAGAGSWSHQYADPGNTGSSDDPWVRSSIDLLWYGEPGAGETPDRHKQTVAPLSHNGRVFHQGYNYQTGRTYIICYDAYNGVRIWETDLTGAYRVGSCANVSNLACTDDYLFVVVGNQCKRLDVATGTVSATYDLPNGCTEAWGYIAVVNGLLVGSETLTDDIDSADFQKSDLLFARDIVTGNLEWTYSNGIFRNNMVSISDGRVLFAEKRAGQDDGLSAEEVFVMIRQGLLPPGSEPDPVIRTAVALDLTDGDVLWSRVIDLTYAGMMSMAKNNVLVFGVLANPYGGVSNPNRHVMVLSAQDGTTLWDKAVGNMSRLLIMGNTLIAQPSAYNLSSGEQWMVGSLPWNFSRTSACGAISASASMMFFRGGHAQWFDAFTRVKTTFFGLRPGCWINMVPASGVVVQPEASSGCLCYYSLQCAITYKSTASGPNAQPTVSITDPEEDEVFNDAITIAATASDSDGSITRVEFYADGSYIGEDSSSPFGYTWAEPPVGTHDLTAKSYDNEGGHATSAAVSVRENDPPTVSLTAPSAGNVHGVINMTATASDTDSTVTKVEFFEDGNYLGEDTTSPYTCSWASPPYGAHELTARATDSDGGITISSAVNVTETNAMATVSITAPTDYQRFVSTPASINITVNAADSDGTIANVEFYNGTTKLGEDSTSPYSYDWTGVSAGAYLLTAKAIDDDSVITTSTVAHVNAGPNSSPTVSLTAPTNGAMFIAGSNITLTATASDVDGSITKVAFYDGDVKLGEDSTSPYSLNWTVPYSIHTLTTKATDNESAVTTSATVGISVWNTVDVGTVGVTGSASCSDNTFTVLGAGANSIATYTTDAFRFVYQQVTGDCTIIARITYFDNTSYFRARAGVIIRESLANNSKNAGSLFKPYNYWVYFNKRTTTGAAGVDNYLTAAALPYWVKLVRSTNTLTGYMSANGSDWTQVGTATVTMTNPVYVGLIVSSNQSTTTKTATFDNVSVTGTIVALPSVSMTAPANGARYASAPANITLTADAADADGTVSKVEFYQGTTLLNTDSVSPYSYDWTNVADNDYSVTAVATDNAGGITTSNPVILHVGPNHNPSASVTSPAPDAVFNGAISIAATASDTDGTISKVEFYEDGNKIGEDMSSPYTYDWASPPVGTHALTAKAIDNESGETTSSSVSVRENTPPTVSITDPISGSSVTQPVNITIAATATDTDGSISLVEFYQGTTKLGEDSTSPYGYTWNSAPLGYQTLTAKAIDNDSGNTTSDAVNVTVLEANILPTVSITAPVEGDAFNGAITITADASDEDGLITKVEFYQGTTKLGEDTVEPYSYEWASPPVGTYALTTKAYDDDNDITTSDAVNVRENNPPTVSITDPEDEEEFLAPADITITVTASDTDGTISVVEFYNGTTKLGEDSTSPYSYACDDVSADDYTLTATAIDNDSRQTTSTTIDIHVDSGGNSPPTVSLTAPADDTNFVGTSYTLTATASDTDGTITKVEFYQGTTKLGEDSTSPYSYDWSGITADAYAITAKAIDDDTASTDSSAADFIVWNTADIGSVGASGSASYSSGTFTVTGAGAGIQGTADACHFIYRRISGDCTIIVRQVTNNGTATNARAGAMIRETLNAGAKEASSLFRPGTYTRAQYHFRNATDGSTTITYTAVGALPYWQKLVRTGDVFKAYHSSDGTTWTQVGSTWTNDMTDPVYIGLTITSGTSGTLKTATFDNLSITSP